MTVRMKLKVRRRRSTQSSSLKVVKQTYLFSADAARAPIAVLAGTQCHKTLIFG